MQTAGNSAPKATAIFENLNVPANAIADFDKDISLGGMVQLNRGVAGAQWYLLEGVANYDPCVCQHESGLVAEPLLTKATSLNFNMDGTGTSETLYESDSPLSTLGYFNGLAGKIFSGYKKYKDYGAYKEEAEKNEGKTVKVMSSLLSSFAEGTNLVSGVTELLGFVLGKKSSSTAAKLTGFNHNFNFTANGALGDSSVYEPYRFYTPGSFYQEEQLQANRPIYDNPLGILAVLEPPVVERQETRFSGDVGNDMSFGDLPVIRWRFTGGLRYHINTIAGISDQPVQLLASLVWPSQCNNEADFFATPAINITCLEDFVVEFGHVDETMIDPVTGMAYDSKFFNGCYGDPELQIVAVLTSTGPTPGQEILYSARYATRTRRVPAGTIGRNPFAGSSIEQISNRCSGSLPRPVSGFQLSRFCERRYDPDFGKSGLGQDIWVDESTSTKEPEPSDLAAFPNPFTNELSVEISDQWINTPLQFQLHDVLGRLAWQQENTIVAAGTYNLENGLDKLPSGTYLMTVSSRNVAKTFTLQKN
jgi:hypothetical protein